jgi:uncharacterized protein (DUF427 family)
MTARATWNGEVLAESEETIIVEGNHYFPADAVRAGVLQPSDTHTHCPWKGDASYATVTAGGETNPDAAWFYPEPFPAATAIKDYVAFWKGVEVTADPGDGTPGPTPGAR